MKISVAMATFNGEKYIEEQIESLRKQTYPADEVIIVDDCSSDDTVSIIANYIKEFGLSSWVITARDTNQGYIKTFREALSYTTGEIIFLCDQDDVWFPEKIKTMKYTMANDNHILMLSCNDIEVDEMLQPKKMKLKFNKSHNNRIPKRIREKGVCICTSFVPPGVGVGCCCAIRRELCNEYLSSSSFAMPHDTTLAWFAALKNRMYFLNTTLIYRRKHSNNVTNQYKRIYSINSRIKQAKHMLLQYDEFMTILEKCIDFQPHMLTLSRKWIVRVNRFCRLQISFLSSTNFYAWLKYGLICLIWPVRIKAFLLDTYLVIFKKR